VEKFRGKYTVTAVLQALGVARSTYYRWAKNPAAPLTAIEIAIKTLCQDTKYRYGHRKITILKNSIK
jgi:putative transposase